MRLAAWLALSLAALGLLLAPRPAAAAQAAQLGPAAGHSISYSSWTIAGDTVRLRYILPTNQVMDLVAPGAARLDPPGIAKAIAPQLAVTSAKGDCEAFDQGAGVGTIFTMALTPGVNRFEIVFVCPSADGLVLADHVLFDRRADHINYAAVQVGAAKPTVQMFTRGRQTLALPTGQGRLRDASVLRFLRQGAGAILGHPDRLCVVLGLLLLAIRWRDLGAIAAALGLGYLASVVLALTGATVDLNLASAAVGLLVALLGASALRLAAGPSAPKGWRMAAMASAALIALAGLAAAARAGPWNTWMAAGLMLFGAAQVWAVGAEPRLRWLALAPAVLFGLLDGADLAGDLSVLQPRPLQLTPLLLGYDLGAIAAGVALVAAVMGLLWLVRQKVRPARTVAVDLAGAALVGAGVFWFVSRLHT
jgi:hypothetical protein